MTNYIFAGAGDADQLPPVGPGSVLSAAIAAHAVPVVDLRDIFRQARQSNIVTSAHDIHCGRFPSLAPVPPRLPVRLLWPLVAVQVCS